MYWLHEDCIMMWYDKPTGDLCLCKKCCLREQWSAVTLPYLVHSAIQSENTRFETLRFSTLTKMSIDVADRSLLPLLSHRSLSVLSGCPIINICSCLQDMKLLWIGPLAYHPLTRFHYSKILNYLCDDYGSFSTISGMDFGGNGYIQVFSWLRC